MFRLYKVMAIILTIHVFIYASGSDKNKVDSTNAIPYKYIVSNLRNSIDLFSDNVIQAQSINYKYGEAVALTKLSLALGIRGEHEKSVEAIFKAIKIFEKLGLVDELSVVYGEYGYGIKRRDLKAANHYMRIGIDLAEENKLMQNLTSLYDNFGVLKLMEGKLDSALYFYSKALDLKYQLKDSVGVPYSLNKIAEVYANDKKFEKAFKYLKESDKIRANEKGEFGRTENLVHRGDVYMQMGKTDSAITYFTHAINKGKLLKYKHLVQYCFNQLTHLYENKKNYIKALENFKQYISYKDSVLNFETNSKISELQIAYEAEKKDRLITENKIELQTKSFQLHFSLALLVIILIALVFIYRYNKLKQIRIRKEFELKTQLKQAEIEQKVSDEKLRISKELHDNIGSNLTFMISSLDNMEYLTKNKGMQLKLKNLGSFGREAIEDLRNSIWAIKKEDGDIYQLILKVKGLKRKINENISQPEINITEDINQVNHLTSIQMLNLYRFIQEAIQNSIKHANAHRVKINFTETEEILNITINDDGTGFDLDKIRGGGNGLLHMKNRIEEAGGCYEISSSPKGTYLSCTINKK